MKKTQTNLYFLYMLFATALITCNCIATKVFVLPFELFGAPVSLTVGAICYPFTFLITDILSELWGKKEANYAVKFGFICQIISTAIVIIARYLPASDVATQEHYVALLGQNWVFVVASLGAYFVSQKFDLLVFHGIRNAYIKKHGEENINKGKWIWNNVGTISSQLIDTIIYASIAFGLGFGWFFDPTMRIQLINMMLGQWLVKSIIALLDTPLFYLFTRKVKE